jgi:hypothetical protein
MPAGTFRDLANGAGAIQSLLQRYTFAFFTQLSQGRPATGSTRSTGVARAGC